jgi:DNA-binding MarR family transcriptional regulator
MTGVDERRRAQMSAQIFGAFTRIVHRTGQDAAAILRRDGLNPAQFQLLRAVAEFPGITQAWLVQHRGVTPGGVSQLVSKVEALGLVRREADGAANRLWLTDEGAALVERLVPDQDAFFARRFAVLDADALEQLHALTQTALDHLPDEN